MDCFRCSHLSTSLSVVMLSIIIGLILAVQIDAFSFRNPIWASTNEQQILSERTAIPANWNGKRIAVIGAGSAGSSSAYYLRRYIRNSSLVANASISITVFDSKPYVGGRSTTINAYNDPQYPIELGASIFVDVNRNLMTAAAELGLNISDLTQASTHARKENTDVLGIFDGTVLRFTYPEGRWASIAKIIWRYGILTPWRTQKLTESTVGKFLKMYEPPIFPFTSLSDAVEHVGLLNATSSTGQQYLAANGIEGAFATELIQASTRVNYGQNLGLIHGVETMVCMATDAAHSVDGGNWRIFAGMLDKSAVDLRLNTTVKYLAKRNDSVDGWNVVSQSATTAEAATEFYDSVIIAAPYQFANLSIWPTLEREPPSIPYVTLHVTLFASSHQLDPVYFGLNTGQRTPQIILTTLNAEEQADPSITKGRGVYAVGSVGFFSISTDQIVSRPGNITEYIYKIFSPKEFTDENIEQMLSGVLDTYEEDHGPITWSYRHVWDAYPYELPRVKFEESKIASDLWYTGGIESFISTMETSSLMGMNVARLIVNEWEMDRKAQL